MIQPYEWAFKVFSSTLPTTLMELNFTNASQLLSYKPQNPPLIGTSKMAGHIPGENKKLVKAGYEKFITTVIEKIIKGAKFPIQSLPEDILLPPSSASINSESDSSNSPQWIHTALDPLEYASPTAIITSSGTEAYGISPSTTGESGRAPSMRSPTDYQHSSIASLLGAIEPDVRITITNKGTTSPRMVAHAKDDLTPRPSVDLTVKPARKHLLRDSWRRWANKRKEQLLKSMTRGVSRSGLERGSGTHETIVTSQSTDTTPFGASAVLTGMSAASQAHQTNLRENSPLSIFIVEAVKENCNQPTGTSSDGDLDFKDNVRLLVRPSVHTFFTLGISKSSLKPKNICAESFGSPSGTSGCPSNESMNITQTTSPSHIWPLQVRNHWGDDRVSCRLPRGYLKGSTLSNIHAWYRSRFNSSTPNSPVEARIDAKTNEYILRGRGVERSQSVVGTEVQSPTSTSDWAARNLIHKVKKSRGALQGVHSFDIELCRELKDSPGDINGKENEHV